MKKNLSVVAIIFIIVGFGFGQSAEKRVDYYDCLYAFFKGTKETVSNDSATDYMKLINYKDYEKYNRDEFEWNDKLSEYKKEFIQKIEIYDLTANYNVATGLEFEKYDFDRGGFAVKINEGVFFPLTVPAAAWKNINFKDGGLIIQNLSKYNFFTMEKETAKAFLNARKSSSGYINREIAILIHFTLSDFNSKDYAAITSIVDKKQYYPVVGRITSIDVYDKNTKIGVLEIK